MVVLGQDSWPFTGFPVILRGHVSALTGSTGPEDLARTNGLKSLYTNIRMAIKKTTAT